MIPSAEKRSGRTRLGWIAALVTATVGIGVAQSMPQRAVASEVNTRIPLAEIQSHIDREWVRTTLVHGLLDYWMKNSVEPNGFIQEDLDRQWKPWGTQREATINGQGRQLVTMAVGYDLTKDKNYLDALTRGMAFLMKMRDSEYGGYYDRVSPDFTVITDAKTGYSSFALDSLAYAYRVTGDKKYADAAMVLFREVRDKMRDGPFIGAGSYTRDFMKPLGGGAFGGGGGRGQGTNTAVPGAGGRADAVGASGGARPGAGPGGAAGVGAARAHGVNLHMFEALLALYEATRNQEVWYEINSELNAIQHLFNYDIGYFPEAYDQNWKGVGNPSGNPSGNPGHLFEWASLLSRAVELGADPKFIALGNRNLDLGLKSYNDAVGGLGGVDANGQPAQMLWWPQCEVLKATATYAILHGRSDLWPYFNKTLDFVKKQYFDTEDGGWFEAYVPGQPRSAQGEKAFYKGSVDGPEWGSYHQTMMMSELWRITDPNYKAWPTKQ